MPSDRLGGDGGVKFCAECFEEVEAEPAEILSHYLEEHPQSDALSKVLRGKWVVVECQDCGGEFYATVNYADGSIGADAYCPDCDDEGYRRIYAQTLSPAELLEREGDPSEDYELRRDGGGELIIYRDDYLIVRQHVDERVAIQVGNPPKEGTPTIVSAPELRDALGEYLTEVGHAA